MAILHSSLENNKPVILIIDDEVHKDSNLQELCAFLKKHYRLVAPIEDWEKGVECFENDVRETIDVVLLDIHFDSDEHAGIKALRKIRDIDPYIPVGMMTAYDNVRSAFKAGQNLANFYLPKHEFLGYPSHNFRILTDEIDRHVEEAKNRFGYNRWLMEEVNLKLAEDYERKENASVGTVAFRHWEDEIVLDATKDIDSDVDTDCISVLDIACGHGRFEQLLQKMSKEFEHALDITAIDFSGEMIKHARRKYHRKSAARINVTFQRRLAEWLPYKEHSFHLILVCFGVLSYTKNTVVLPKIWDLLQPGGVIIATVYNRGAQFHKISDSEHLKPEHCPLASKVEVNEVGKDFLIPQGEKESKFPIDTFLPEEFKKLLGRQGFHVVRSCSFPVLYSFLPTFIPLKDSKLSRAVTRRPSRWSERIKLYPNPNFSEKLYIIDRDYCSRLDACSEHLGYYFTVVARKPNKSL